MSQLQLSSSPVTSPAASSASAKKCMYRNVVHCNVA